MRPRRSPPMDPDTTFRMPPMRPVDHVEVDPPQGFWYRSATWRGWILPVLFSGLPLAGAVISLPAGWWSWWLHGTVVILVMLAANSLLKRLPSGRQQAK